MPDHLPVTECDDVVTSGMPPDVAAEFHYDALAALMSGALDDVEPNEEDPCGTRLTRP